MCDPIPAPRCCTQIWLTALNTWVLKEAWTIVNISWTRTVLIFGDVFLHCPTNEVWTTGPFRAMLTETCVSPCWLTHSVVNCCIASSKCDWGTLLKNPTRSSLMAANWTSSSVWENRWWTCFQISGTESWPASCGQSITQIVSRVLAVACMSLPHDQHDEWPHWVVTGKVLDVLEGKSGIVVQLLGVSGPLSKKFGLEIFMGERKATVKFSPVLQLFMPNLLKLCKAGKERRGGVGCFKDAQLGGQLQLLDSNSNMLWWTPKQWIEGS